MSYTLFQCSLAGFLLAPAVILYLRFVVGSRLPWWGVLLAIACAGWLFSNLSVHFYLEAACADVLGVSDPPADALDRCVNDGAKRVAMLFFGGVAGLVYAAPYLLVYRIALGLRDRRKGAAGDA